MDFFNRKKLAALQLDLVSAIENANQLTSENTALWHEIDRLRAEYVPAPRRKSKFFTAVAIFWIFLVGLLVGGSAVPHVIDAPTLSPDYSGCISTYTYENPLEDRYQELVNALWACEVFEAVS